MSNIIENNRYDIVTLLRAFGIILSFKLVSIIYILLNNLSVDNLVDFPILTRCIHVPYMWGIYTIIGIALPVCFGEIFMIIKNKYTKVVYEK